MSSDKEDKKIKVMFVLEMVGRPAEHLTETMNKIIDQIKEEKDVKVISTNLKEPHPMKDHEEFFTTFCEIDLEVKEILNLALLLFKYMPAHVEIYEPENLSLSNNGWNDIFNELMRRLHGYDEVARTMEMKNSELQKKLKEVSNSEEKK